MNFMNFNHNAKNAATPLITNLFVIKTNAFFAAIASVLVMKFKALEQLISRRGPILGALLTTILIEGSIWRWPARTRAPGLVGPK